MRASGIRPRPRGFSLIEIGIVIVVITILATIVLVGRDLLVASRVSQVIATVERVQAAADAYAGASERRFPGESSTTLLNDLFDRELLSFGAGAEVAPSFTFDRAGHDANGRRYYLTITCSAPTSPGLACDDILEAARGDRAFVSAAANVNGVACTVEPAGSATIHLCYDL